MRVIINDTIDTISADSEQPNFPATNLQDEHPKKQWKAAIGDSVVKVTARVSEMTDALAMFNIMADQISVEVYNPNDVNWEAGVEWEAGVSWDMSDLISSSYVFGAESFSEFKSLWVDFSSSITFADITITLTSYSASVNPVSAGVVVAGEAAVSTRDIDRPLNESSEDYSIKAELSNGARYYKKRDIVRTFSCSILLGQSEEFYTFMNIARAKGEQPLAWRLLDSENHKWVVYASFNGMPTGSHAYTCDSTFNFNLIEVL